MQALASPSNCCSPCEDQATTQLVGPQGKSAYQVAVNNGFVGTEAQWLASLDGATGLNSFTELTAPFTVPNAGAPDIAEVTNSAWASVDQILFLEGPVRLVVVSIPDFTHIELDNTDYPGNLPDGTVIPIGSRLGPDGLMGIQGTPGTGSGDMLSADNLAVGPTGVANAATARTNLGLGTVATKTSGVANTNVASVDDAAGLTNGEAVFATAAGIESKTAATARTALGLGTISTQASSAVAITGGAIDGTALGGTTRATAKFTTLDANGAAVLSANLTNSAKLFLTASAIQTLAAGNVINPNATRVKVVGSGAPVTLTTTPTITAPAADGQLLIVQGNDNTNTLTVQDEASLAGSKLKLGAASRTLGKGDTLILIYDFTDGFWYELAFVNVT